MSQNPNIGPDQLKAILGEQYVEVAEMLSDVDPNALVAGVHQAADYIKNNAKTIAKNRDAAKEILTMVRQAADEVGVNDIEPQLSALQKEIVAPETEIKINSKESSVEPNRGVQEENKEQETPQELAVRLNEVIDFFIEEIKEGKVGSYDQAIIKLDQWEDQIYDLSPQDLLTAEVKSTLGKLNNLKTEITQARMRGIKDVPTKMAA